MDTYIVVEDRKTWPVALYEEAKVICQKLDLPNRINVNADVDYYTLAEIQLRPYCDEYAIKDYEKFYNMALKEKVLCHHFTRLLEPARVRQEGIRCNTWNNYKTAMTDNLLKLGVTSKQIEKALGLLQKEHDRKYGKLFPANDVNFTTSPADIHADVYSVVIGGELAVCLENESDIYTLLESAGSSCRVDFVIPIYDINDSDSFIYKLLVCELSKILWDKEYPLYFDEIVKRDISKDEIVRIVEL